MNVTQYGLQECYKRANTALMNAGLSQAEIENAVVSQSYLRLEQPLNNSSTVFNFPILNNEQNPGQQVRATEVRLAQQDTFFCSNISIYLALASSGSAVNFPLKTYPSPTVFTTGAASLYAFYNGWAKITINKSVIVPNYPLTNFLQVMQTQQTAATNSPLDQFDPSQVSLWEPNINFVGTKSSKISIELPGNIGTIDANTYAVIILQGVLAQNVTLMS